MELGGAPVGVGTVRQVALTFEARRVDAWCPFRMRLSSGVAFVALCRGVTRNDVHGSATGLTGSRFGRNLAGNGNAELRVPEFDQVAVINIACLENELAVDVGRVRRASATNPEILEPAVRWT